MEWELLGIILAGMVAFTCYFFKIPLPLPVANTSKDIREDRFDILRGFSMIGIVMIHIHSYFQFFHPADSQIIQSTLFFSNLARFSVPIFILTSAIFLRKKHGYWTSKLNHLIIPYVVFSILGYLIKYKDYQLFEFFEFLLLGKVFTPFYFVPLLLQFYMLFFIFDSVFTNEKWQDSLLLLAFLTNFGSNIGIFDSILPKQYHAISIFNYIFFFVLGIRIGKNQIENTQVLQRTKYIFSVYLVVFIVLLIINSFIFEYDLKNHHTIYPIFMMIFFWNYLNQFNRRVTKILCFIGNQSLYIFLLHPFIIHFMHSVDPYIFGGPTLGYFFTLVLNVGIPSFAAFIIQKGKFLYQSHRLT